MATRGIRGLQTAADQALVTLDSDGTGSATVTFDSAFPQAPSVHVVPMLADSTGVYSASSVTADGFTLNVVGSTLVSTDVNLVWLAHQKT